jgi:predicted O-methyltransferase YrrM
LRRSRRVKRRASIRLSPFSAQKSASWYEGKSFTADWTSWNFANWARLLRRYRGRRVRALEIGSWEGRSALFFLNFLPRARLTCIDTFGGGREHRKHATRSAKMARILRNVERRFDANTKQFKKRLEKIKSRSVEAMAKLAIERRRFDFAYIDGGHLAVEAYTDATLTWPLMVRGGIVIFNDYQYNLTDKPLDNPAPGIDAFLASIKDQYRIVHKKYQIAIVKR